MQDDIAGTNAGTGRWLTYDELAEVRGIKRIGAVRLAQRHKWRRQAGNDGKARVLVPHDALALVRGTIAGSSAPTAAPRRGTSTDAVDDAGNSAGNGAGIDGAQFLALLKRAEQRADEAQKRADAADANRRTAEARADRAEQAAANERERIDKLAREFGETRQETAAMAMAMLEEARQRADRAEALAAGERHRADAIQAQVSEIEEALAFERVRVESLQRDLAGSLSIATEKATAADEAIGRAQAAQERADALTAADASRKGRGRWARLRAAWRGE